MTDEEKARLYALNRLDEIRHFAVTPDSTVAEFTRAYRAGLDAGRAEKRIKISAKLMRKLNSAKEALAFYAYIENWKLQSPEVAVTSMELDRGRVATVALGELEGYVRT